MEVNTEIHLNNSGQPFKVLKEFKSKKPASKGYSKKLIVQFINTGTVKECFEDNALKGKVRDDYAVSVYGVGYLGFRKKGTKFYSQARQLWTNMLKRCYSKVDPKGYQGSVTVDSRWLCLANFIEDLPKLENFDKWLSGHKSTTKWQLDKDLDSDGTVYSLHTCRFLSEYENKSAGAKNAREWDSRYGGVKPKHKVLTRDLASE